MKLVTARIHEMHPWRTAAFSAPRAVPQTPQRGEAHSDGLDQMERVRGNLRDCGQEGLSNHK